MLKKDARALLPGEEDDPESGAEAPPSDNEEYEDNPAGGHLDIGQGSSSGYHGGGFYDFTERAFVDGWAFGGSMQEVIESQRPQPRYLTLGRVRNEHYLIIKR